MQGETGVLELNKPKDSYDSISKTQLRDRNHNEYSIGTFEKEYLKKCWNIFSKFYFFAKLILLFIQKRDCLKKIKTDSIRKT